MRKKEQTSSSPSAREKIADSLDISKEILLGSAKIVTIGNREMTVENYKGIIEYTNSCIRLTADPTDITISGNGLEIKTMTRDFLYITGKICSVSFCKESR